MEKFALNKKMLRQLSLMNNYKEPSPDVLDSLFAQMFLEISIYRFRKNNLLNAIDQALDVGEKEQFTKLVESYHEFLNEYKDGIHFFEKGFQLTINIEDF